MERILFPVLIKPEVWSTLFNGQAVRSMFIQSKQSEVLAISYAPAASACQGHKVFWMSVRAHVHTYIRP